MTNALTTTGGGFLSNMDDNFAALQEAVSDLGGGAGGGIYMKFNGNDGLFTYGSTGDELPAGTQLAFNPSSLERGWICWKDEEVVDEKMVGFTQKQIAKGELTDHGPYEEKSDGWQEQSIISFKMVEEPFHDLIFKATGIGKRNAVARLMQDYVKSYKANPGLIPIVEIDETSYESKAKGARGARKHAPVFKIIAWVTEADLLNIQEGGAGDYEPDEAAPQLEAPTEVVEEVVATEPAPVRAAATRPARTAKPAAAPVEEPAPAAAQPAARRGRF